MLYVERMVGTGQMIRCDTCHKMIRWPEEARIYADNMNAKPNRFEHTEHEVQPNSHQVHVS